MPKLGSSDLVYVASGALHLAIGGVLAVVHVAPPPEVVAIELQTIERPKDEEEDEPEPEPVPVAPPRQAAPAKADAAPPAAPDYGFVLGPGGGPGGVAVPAPAPAAPVRQATRVLSTVAPQPTCTEADTKPKLHHFDKPPYTGVDGKVRVELAIDATGAVTDAKVVEGVDPALDAAAVAALRQARFQPATHCGKPVATTFVVGLKFAPPA